ncbi:methylcytosine dioxygenase TET-like [Musca vetustissima]|uniref:methylcytosine dioxygenase TET-like n=1 Tax=Musca vetustissima TaxID=27455 RepID=UPI002AB65574|nr:methylcytosine dioxygenase TET-like [Musca vetustissima]
MLKRSKSNRSQRTNRRSASGKAQQQRLETVEDSNRHSDGDSSQSSVTAPASVHRTRHAGMKRNDAATINNTSAAATNGTTAAIVHTTGNTMAAGVSGGCGGSGGGGTTSRPSYQQYQQQRRMQFQQQQQQQKQMHFQQPYYSVNIANMPKTKCATNIGQQQQQQIVGGAGPVYDVQQKQQQQNHFLQTSALHHNHQQQQQRLNHCQQQLTSKSLNSQAMSRIPIQHQKMQPQPHQQLQNPHHHLNQQQQQQQQHQLPTTSTFNHISKNATNLLNDIYERNLLSQTTFGTENEQQQQQFMPQIPLPPAANGSQNWSQKSRELKTFNKIIAPPTSGATSIYQPSHFQFSDSYVEPVDTKKHFLMESQPPPPPAPLNHVYETIKERPPLPLPPPPPERNQNVNNTPPPLPPSRLLKKKLLAAAAAAAQGEGNTGRSGHKSHKKSSHDKQLEQDKKSHHHHNNKLAHNQPPAYVAPPPITMASNVSSTKNPAQPAPYNPQQRTKADGEHKSMLYQQLREQKLQHHQQQQQQKLMPSTESAGNGGQHLSNNMQKHNADKLPVNGMREHPLGAHDEGVTTDQPTTNNNHNSQPAAVVPTSGQNGETITNDIIDMEPECQPDTDGMQQLTVEQALHQAGLLPNSNSNNNNSSAITATAQGSSNNNGHNNRPSALPIVFEEDTGEFQDVLVLEEDGTAKLPYRHGKKIEVSLETAQAMAAAAYYARTIAAATTLVHQQHHEKAPTGAAAETSPSSSWNQCTQMTLM